MKSNLTKEIEAAFLEYLYWEKNQNAVIECRLGTSRKYGIVDVISLQSQVIHNGRGKPITREFTFRCYELKVTKSDFKSDARLSFHGDYNFFVLTPELWKQVKDEIPSDIGVFIYNGKTNIRSRKSWFSQVKRSKRMNRTLSDTQLINDFVVSASRDSRRWVNYNQ